MTNARMLSAEKTEGLLQVLRARFERNMPRHGGLDWPTLRERLEALPEKLWTLGEMERTGGEPDVVGRDAQTGESLFCDCSAESPAGRRSLCYDGEALESRRENRPAGSAVGMANAMGVELLSEDMYRALQRLGPFDCRTSSWLATPLKIRALGGALFGDRRYDRVFTYHNGAQSYYAARGFRSMLRV